MKETFMNLLNNAFDAVPAVGGEVEVRSQNKEGSVEIRVWNNGEPIDKEIQNKVFDPFFTTKAKGTGLGLTVCRQIVHMHDGEIKITSGPGWGTEVSVVLPKQVKAAKKGDTLN